MTGIIIVLLFFVSVLALVLFNQYQFKKSEKRNPPKGRFVDVDGVKLHYLRQGKGQPVVLLHGGVTSCEDFTEVLYYLSNKEYDCISFDRPGYGHSDRPKKAMSADKQAELIHKALYEIGIVEPVIIVGHSWSGTLTLSYARQFPKDVANIVTLGAAMYKEGYPAERGDLLSKLIMTPLVGTVLMNTLLATPVAKRMGKQTVVETFKPEVAPSGYEQRLLDSWGRPKQFRANREDVLLFPECAYANSHHYCKITTPITIIVGDSDPFNTVQMANRLFKETEYSNLFILENVGHMIPQKHPQQVADLIDRTYWRREEKDKSPSSSPEKVFIKDPNDVY
ncbi:alpha/beta fold hydrolase [Geomicrobium sp. JSM 1781026]|uniref:alpha/beta fold hydrolase n=1 Tax=Geomicrobium sp. JSM 1781026 TaxID=3344580 RepID=UPI0035BF0C11